MKLQMKIGDTDVMFTPEQLEAMHAILQYAEVLDLKYKGTGKGFYGTDNEYEADIILFDPYKHGNGVKVLPNHTIEALRDIISMRKQGEK